ncbi:MAG: homoserine dehydrogenase [Clostridia bacterium]|nr:homoserine dehydrogenase [Clostridia bacterium]
MTNIAILGFGTVGSGVAQVLTDNREIIRQRIASNYSIKYILDLRDFPDSPFADLITHDFDRIIHDPDVTVVAEMMGGSHPAYEFTKACLEAGKSVVSSNKEVVANFGPELLATAKTNHVSYLFEASVGGGIPIITTLGQDLAANRILSVSGILNGTTNYILTRMEQDGMAFADALADAQSLGYAERNPSADIQGLDAARKIAILAAMAYGKMIPVESVLTEGIAEITKDDIILAKELGFTLKLIGHATCEDGKLLAMVTPRFVPQASPLAGVNDVFNAVLVRADMLGDSMYYGRGAGKLPTASAVCADILSVIRNSGSSPMPDWADASEDELMPLEDYACRNCFIFSGKDFRAEKYFEPQKLSCDGELTAAVSPRMTEKDAMRIEQEADPLFVKRFRILD